MKHFPVILSMLSISILSYHIKGHVNENSDYDQHQISLPVKDKNNVLSTRTNLRPSLFSTQRTLASNCKEDEDLFEISTRAEKNIEVGWWLVNECDFSSPNPTVFESIDSNLVWKKKTRCIPVNQTYSFIIATDFKDSTSSMLNGKGHYKIKFNGVEFSTNMKGREQNFHKAGSGSCDLSQECDGGKKLLEITTRGDFTREDMNWFVARKCKQPSEKDPILFSGVAPSGSSINKVTHCIYANQIYVFAINGYLKAARTNGFDTDGYYRIKFNGHEFSNDFKSSDRKLLVLNSSAGCPETKEVVFTEDFEKSEPWDNFVIQKGDVKPYTGVHVQSGKACLRMSSDTGAAFITSDNMDASKYKALEVKFMVKPTLLKKGQGVALDYFVDKDVGWVTRTKWLIKSGITNGEWSLGRSRIAIDSESPPANMRIRFRIIGRNNAGRLFLDDVEVRGVVP